MKPFLLRLPFILLLFLFLIQGCKNEEELINPEIKTMEISAQSPETAVLQGDVVATGKYPVADYGFMYGFTPDLDINRGVKASMGKAVQAGFYSKEITGLSIVAKNYSNPILYARAYITNEKGTILGQVMSAKLPLPIIGGIAPNTGKAGDRIIITGNFHTSNPDKVQVTFGNVIAREIEVTPSKIVVEVPSGISYGYYSSSKQVAVVLKTADQEYNVSSSFLVIPSVREFLPKSGQIGTQIVISADNLPTSVYSNVKVFIGKQEVSAYNRSSSEIRVTVPNSLGSQKSTISVFVDGVTTVLPGEFTLLPFAITDISPAAGLTGSTFTISGGAFSAGYDYNSSNISVMIGDEKAPVDYINSDRLTVTVPKGMLIGNHKITVTIGPYTVEAPQQFEVLAPTVTGFSPTSAGWGNKVTIYGNFQPGKQYNVYFGSAGTNSIGGTTANAIHVLVPPSAPVGKVQIFVQFGTQRIGTLEDFIVLEPNVSFTPASGAAGSTVTINTANFVPNYYTMAKFGTVGAQVLSHTASSMQVVVPTGVTGPVKLSVIHGGKTVTSTDDFTVTN